MAKEIIELLNYLFTNPVIQICGLIVLVIILIKLALGLWLFYKMSKDFKN